MSRNEINIRPPDSPIRQSTAAQNIELTENRGFIDAYLQSLQQTLLEDDLIGKQRNMFSSTLFLLSWLNKNTNIDIMGLKEILNGAYTVIENDNGDLYYEVCQLSKQEKDIERGTAPYFVAGKRISSTPESSHDSCPSKNENAKCHTPEDKDQIRMGQGLLYDCNKSGSCNRDRYSSFFDLIIGVQCNDSKNTWFQFEYARLTGSTSVERFTNKYLLHVYSFLCYAASFCKRNQGTFGTSKFVENGRHYRLLMNENNDNNVSSSYDTINDLNILSPAEKEAERVALVQLEKMRERASRVITIQGGRRKKHRKRKTKSNRKRKTKTKKNKRK